MGFVANTIDYTYSYYNIKKMKGIDDFLYKISNYLIQIIVIIAIILAYIYVRNENDYSRYKRVIERIERE